MNDKQPKTSSSSSGATAVMFDEPAVASIDVRGGDWYPVLEGNATVVYRAEADERGGQAGPVEYARDENAAYATLDDRNTAFLRARGVETAHP